MPNARLIAVRCLDINKDFQLSLWSGVERQYVALSRCRTVRAAQLYMATDGYLRHRLCAHSPDYSHVVC